MNAYQPVESLRQDLAEKGVKYAMASYVDIHGAIKGKFVPLNHLDRMMKGSELYTGAALDGVPQDINDDEVASTSCNAGGGGGNTDGNLSPPVQA